MSNSQQPNLSRAVFIDFLITHGYTGNMSLDSEYITLTKDENKIRIPYKETLTENQIITSLSKSDLSFSDFEEYLYHLKVVEEMTKGIIDKSKE